MIDNVVVPVASAYGLAKEYEYLKSSIRDFVTGFFFSCYNLCIIVIIFFLVEL